jgi:branched-chain amino acid transport system ATP-binding protein
MLEVSGLQVSYGPIAALRDVSLTLAEGEIVTVIGANGAGKSTLLKTICGMLRPASGSITLRGEPIAGRPSSEVVRNGIALVPEGRHVFPEMTVRENLELGAYHRRDHAAIASDLERVLGVFPILREKIRLAGGGLSGGQQQMLAIGRALMSRPKLLMLDEPSLGLAPAIVQQIGGIMRELNAAGTSILLVEQNARMALRLAQRGYVLANGRVTRSGTGRELLADPAVQDAYLGGLAA